MCLRDKLLSTSITARPSTVIVTEAELSYAPLIIMVREVYRALEISSSFAADLFHDLYRDLNVILLRENGEEDMLEMRHLDHDLENTQLDEKCPQDERLRDWFRGLAAPIPESGRVFVRTEARERFRVVATLLIAAMPDLPWPRLIAANDTQWAANDRSYDPSTISPKPRDEPR